MKKKKKVPYLRDGSYSNFNGDFSHEQIISQQSLFHSTELKEPFEEWSSLQLKETLDHGSKDPSLYNSFRQIGKRFPEAC